MYFRSRKGGICLHCRSSTGVVICPVGSAKAGYICIEGTARWDMSTL